MKPHLEPSLTIEQMKAVERLARAEKKLDAMKHSCFENPDTVATYEKRVKRLRQTVSDLQQLALFNPGQDGTNQRARFYRA